MKSGYIIISFCLLALTKLQAQDASVKLYRNAISVNLTTPLIQAINKNKPDTTALRVATNIAYSRIFGKHTMLRIGVGGFNNYQTLASDIFIDRKIENTNKITALLSIYRLTNINNAWLFGCGISCSGVYNQLEKLSDSGFDIVKSYEYSKGGGIGPAVLFQYNLNKRLSMYSEYSILYNIYETAQGRAFSAYPDLNYARNKLINQGIQFQFPLAIYVNYHF